MLWVVEHAAEVKTDKKQTAVFWWGCLCSKPGH